MIRQWHSRVLARRLNALCRAVTIHAWRLDRARCREDRVGEAVHLCFCADLLEQAAALIRASVTDPHQTFGAD